MAASDHLRFFPKPEPYDGQAEAMDRIANALAREQDVLFEGACGTGKTLAALVPALQFAREEEKTVAITTNVHQQMRQFVTEAREIHAQEPVRAVVFKGKAKMCHVDVGYEECQVLRDNTYELVDAERDRQELERREQELLAAAREGNGDAAERRNAVLDELEAVEERVEDLREGTTCDHYYGNLTEEDAVAEFDQWLFDGVRTPEEVYEYAGQRGLCGYELLKDAVEGVDLVVCNYHHLLDPTIREQFFRWLGRDPGDVVAVFDEAHNVADAARDHAARTLTESTLESALEELDGESDSRADAAANVLGAFRDALVETYEDELGFRDVGEDWTDLAVRNDEGRDDLTLAFLRSYAGKGIDADLAEAQSLGRELDERYETAYREGDASVRQECQTLQAATFVASYLDEGDEVGRYPVVGVRRDAGTGDVYGRAELYTCIPREVTRGLFDSVHASVLMSATLRPFEVSGTVLGLEEPAELAYGLTFPEENRRTYAVDTPPLFASERDDPEVQAAVADALADAVTYTPGNVLAFFPSYAEAARYHDRLSERLAVPTYLDQAGESAEELRQSFVAEDGAVLCTSLWGTLTEGVSFDGDDATTAAVVGVPYPRLDDRAEAVQEAYDRAFGPGEDGGTGSAAREDGTAADSTAREDGTAADSTAREDGTAADSTVREDAGWRYAVEIPTVRKTRQALGRVLRAPEEVGARLLLDRRYTEASTREMGKYSVRDAFPPEEREELVDVDPEKLRYALHNFFTDHDAWNGDAPGL